MEIKKNVTDETLELAVSGRLDTNTAPKLEETIQGSIAGITTLILDFGELEYVSSAGLRVLLSTQKTMNKQQGKMIVRNVISEIMDVFDITGFSDILTIE